MEGLRKSFEGIWNIIRFNWHFYAGAAVAVILVFLAGEWLAPGYGFYARLLCVLMVLPVVVSLLVSWYVYDLSGLYSFSWLPEAGITATGKIVNINAGFDETSVLLHQKFPGAQLYVFDFYDASKHTEVSIKRARAAYPPYPGTEPIKTSHIPMEQDSADGIFIIFAAHEIRKEEERDVFFAALRRILRPGGKIVVMEHLRDLPNFLAYTIGFFHFMPKASWLRTFERTGLRVAKVIKVTPFISTFILEEYGISS